MNRNKKNSFFILSVSPQEVPNYLSATDVGIQVIYPVDDSETRFEVKFVEYLNVGLQVIVGEYVGEAARYEREEFQERTIIYTNRDDLQNLKHKQLYLRDKVNSLFGFSNFKRIFD